MQKQQQRSPNLLDNEIYLDTYIIIIMCDVHFHFFIHNIFITNSNESKMREQIAAYFCNEFKVEIILEIIFCHRSRL